MDNSFNQYLDILNEQQKEAVIHEGSPLLILAGAGSGKTRVITTKIAYLISQRNVDPYSILSVTFTKKAANEMKERAVAIEPAAEASQIRTFHSFGSWLLRRYASYAGLVDSFTVYDDDDMATLVKKACPNLSVKEANRAARDISLAKDYCLSPEDDLSVIGSEFDLNEIYSAYQARLRATGNADFGDLIMLPVKIIEENQHIKDYIRNRFKVIMVDEYQDSNIAQYKLLQSLSGVHEGSNTYVCVVGDDDQSIYHFRGAEVQNILSFPDEFPETQIIRLEANYRSTSKILNAASIVVSKNQNRLGKSLIADRGEGKMPVLAFPGDQMDEAKFCASLIQKSLDKGCYSDWALLYRTNAQSLSFEKEFLRQKIPYKVVGSLKFYEREEIKDALAYLALCANPRDEISFRRVINKPARGIGEKTQDTLLSAAVVEYETEDGVIKTAYKNLLDCAKESAPSLSKKARTGVEEFVKLFETVLQNFDENKNLSDFIQRIVLDSGLEEHYVSKDDIDGTMRKQNLQELANSAVPYKCTMEGLLEFLDAINLDRALELQQDQQTQDAVTLITLHNTKGLEYNKVIISGLEEGVFPRDGKIGEELEEERRLFYVGITRAKDELYITSASSRMMYGAFRAMTPSKFIYESQEAFKVIGQIPFNFTRAKGSFGGGSNSSFSNDYGEYSELAEKWKKGTKLYHDDYGYGVVIKAGTKESEFVITVMFENGESKKFLPQYQAKALMIIKD